LDNGPVSSPAYERSFIERLKGSMPARVIAAYGASKASNYASGLAFNAFMSMFPLILGVLAIVGLAINDPGVRQHVQDGIVSAFPTSGAQEELQKALNGVARSAGIFGIISIAGLIFGGTNFFAALEFALGEVFGAPQRDFLRQRLMGVIMMVLLIIAIVIAVGANALMNLFPAMAALGPALALATLIGLMLLIYRFVPNRTFRLGEIWQGAVIAGFFIEVITLAFPLYGKLVHGFNSYGAQFALFFLLATWLAFVSQFILLGAVWNRVRIGSPDTEGVIHSPMSESQTPPRPVDAVREQQAGEAVAARSRAVTRAGVRQQRSPMILLAAALAAFVALLVSRRRYGP
jgi:membrane protein